MRVDTDTAPASPLCSSAPPTLQRISGAEGKTDSFFCLNDLEKKKQTNSKAGFILLARFDSVEFTLIMLELRDPQILQVKSRVYDMTPKFNFNVSRILHTHFTIKKKKKSR